MGGGASIAGNNAKIVLKPLVEPEGLYYSLLEQKEFACIGYTDKELRKLAQLIQAFDPELKNQFSIKQFIKKACGMKRLNDITKRLFNVPLGQKDRILTFQEVSCIDGRSSTRSWCMVNMVRSFIAIMLIMYTVYLSTYSLYC